MANVKVIVTDDNGIEISTHSYPLPTELVNLSQIEHEVETIRPQLLCDITHDLLSNSQMEYVKKTKVVGEGMQLFN